MQVLGVFAAVLSLRFLNIARLRLTTLDKHHDFPWPRPRSRIRHLTASPTTMGDGRPTDTVLPVSETRSHSTSASILQRAAELDDVLRGRPYLHRNSGAHNDDNELPDGSQWKSDSLEVLAGRALVSGNAAALSPAPSCESITPMAKGKNVLGVKQSALDVLEPISQLEQCALGSPLQIHSSACLPAPTSTVQQRAAELENVFRIRPYQTNRREGEEMADHVESIDCVRWKRNSLKMLAAKALVSGTDQVALEQVLTLRENSKSMDVPTSVTDKCRGNPVQAECEHRCRELTDVGLQRALFCEADCDGQDRDGSIVTGTKVEDASVHSNWFMGTVRGEAQPTTPTFGINTLLGSKMSLRHLVSGDKRRVQVSCPSARV